MQIEAITSLPKVASKALGWAVREISAQLLAIQEAGLGWLKQFRKGRFEFYVDGSGVTREVKMLHSSDGRPS